MILITECNKYEVKTSIFFERLKARRKEKGIMQIEITKGPGIAQSTYVHYERGNREPDLEMLKATVNISQTAIDYLVGRAKE